MPHARGAYRWPSITAPAHAAGGSRGSSSTSIVLIGKDARLGINDNGVPGSSAGDVRTLALTLTDEGAVDRAVKTLVISLPKGTISGMGVTTFADFSNPASRPNDKTEHLAIVGGTGKYRGASGSVDIEVLANFESRWRISLGR